MNDTEIKDLPKNYAILLKKCMEIGFTMPSDMHVGALLRTLTASKPQANILELGTGIGLSLAWMADGMDKEFKLVSIDNDPQLAEIVAGIFEPDPRIGIITADGSEWLKNYHGPQFDLIFADTWPGKYSEIEIALSLVKLNGFYVIDDMDKQDSWPDGHADKALILIKYLESREDFISTKLSWSSGVVVAVRVR